VSDETIAFIKRWETNGPPVLDAYDDYHQYSIGYGTRSFKGERITAEEAERRLRVAVEGFTDALASRITVALSPEAETGLTSAAFNLGVSAVQPVIALVNRGQPVEAAAVLQRYVFAGGEKLEALVRRRAAEAALLGVAPMTRGAPRLQYERTYWLMPHDATMAEFLQAATAAFDTRATIGFSADDAGIGDLDSRRVILVDVAKYRHGKPPLKKNKSRHPAGMPEWFAQHYPGVDVMGGTAPAPPVAPEPPVSQTKALVGLHGSADGSWGNRVLPPVVDMITAGRFESYKSLSNESAQSVGVLKRINEQMFFCVRMMGKVTAEHPTASDFVDQCGQDVLRWCRELGENAYIELHNEPNLHAEGMWASWQDGAGFATWWLAVRDALKADCPDAKWGYPGLSPGIGLEGVRAPAMQFMAESHEAMTAADWIGVHCYWQSESEMWTLDGGGYYKQIPPQGKPLLITEFSNPNDDTPKQDKVAEYVKYWQSLEGVTAAFAFISTASSGFESETWTQDMARVVGARV